MSAVVSLFGIETAHAQSLWEKWGPACSSLQPGCGEGPANIFLSTLPNLAVFMLQVATGLAVLLIVWSGIQMVTNMGDEGKVGKQRMNIFFSLAGLFVAISSQLFVSFVATQNWGANSQGNLAINVIAAGAGTLLTVFNGVFILVIIYYGIRMLMAAGDSGAFGSARTGLTWAIVGAIVVNLANALVQGITSFFGL